MIIHKLLILDRNTWNHIIVYKLLVLDRNTWNHIIVYKLLVLDRNTWNHIIVYKLLVLDRNTWNHRIVYKLLILDRNTWNHIIIIIMSCRQHGYPWPSLATSPYHSSPPAGLQSYILCPHIVAVCKFKLVVLLLHGHMWGSIGVHPLWARPCFSSSVPRVWFV